MKTSCGIIPFRNTEDGNIEVFVGKNSGMGGAYKTDWMFLKGCAEDGESWQDAAVREFQEETGITLSKEEIKSLMALGNVQQNAHKYVVAFALYKPDIDPSKCFSNLIEGGTSPEIDMYRWMTCEDIVKCTHPTHVQFYNQIVDLVYG